VPKHRSFLKPLPYPSAFVAACCPCGLETLPTHEAQAINELFNMHEQAAIERYKLTLRPKEVTLTRPVLMSVYDAKETGEYVCDVVVQPGAKLIVDEYNSGLDVDDKPTHTVMVKDNEFILGMVVDADIK